MFLNEHIVKCVSMTLGSDLEVAVEGYGSIPRSQASLTAVLQTALWQFLINN